jgi:RNA polymerase sigma-70 factor (ECF subfamily)
MSEAGRTTTHQAESSIQKIIREYTGGQLSRNEALIKIFPLIYRRTLFILKVLYGIRPERDQDDLLQEVMLRVVRSWHTYDPTRPHFLNWLDQITRRVKIDYLKGKNRYEEVFSNPDEEKSDWQITNYAAANPDADIKIDLARLLQELPEYDRVLLHHKFFEGYKDSELAEKYNLRESRIKSHVRRAVAKLCEKLGIDKKQDPPTSPSGQSRSRGSGPSAPELPPELNLRTSLGIDFLAKGVPFMNCTDEELAALFSNWKAHELDNISPEREAQAMARFRRALENEPEPEKAKGVAVGETHRRDNDAGFGLVPLMALVGIFAHLVLHAMNSTKAALNALGAAKLAVHALTASIACLRLEIRPPTSPAEELVLRDRGFRLVLIPTVGGAIAYISGFFGPYRPGSALFWARLLWAIFMSFVLWHANRRSFRIQRQRYDGFQHRLRKMCVLLLINLFLTVPLTWLMLEIWRLCEIAGAQAGLDVPYFFAGLGPQLTRILIITLFGVAVITHGYDVCFWRACGHASHCEPSD